MLWSTQYPLETQAACYGLLAGAIVFPDRYPAKARRRAAEHAAQQAEAQARARMAAAGGTP